jgi:arabinan endo-1,5-alpha-L-arabinosidase
MQRRMLAPSLVVAATSLVALLGGGTFPATAAPLAVSPRSAMPTAAKSPAAGPSRVLHLSGDLHTHDPALTRDGVHGDWYVFSTGDPSVAHGTVQIRRSPDLRHWRYAGTVFPDIPAWVRAAVPNVQNIWAPDVHRHGGLYYLYYAASSFGSNRSVIGVATNTTLDPENRAYRWVDRGLVTQSTPQDDYNAIDPGIVEDAQGRPWMAFGSFWSGIRMLALQWPSGKPATGQAQPLRLADRHVPPNAIEAPYLIRRGGYYYLFVSIDFCCRRLESTYKIAVGRSRSVIGPYYDQLGTPLLHGGGTVILSEHGSMVGPGGQSVYGSYVAHHYYDATRNGDFRLSIRTIGWDRRGWPYLSTQPDPSPTS